MFFPRQTNIRLFAGCARDDAVDYKSQKMPKDTTINGRAMRREIAQK